jgi:AcrR family transcriptional regulator
MSSELPPSTREPGRRGKQGETRARLIQVAIELVRHEGLGALTTSRITKAAGIAQPGFYAHFKNVDDIVRSAVSEVVEEIRDKLRVVRRIGMESLSQGRGAADLDATSTIFRDTMDVLLADPSFAELFLRYRRDPSLLGGFMREMTERVRADIIEDLWRNCQAVGFAPEHYPRVVFWAEQIMALLFAAVETVLDGRQTDRQLVIDSVARSAYAIMWANLQAVGLAESRPIVAHRPPQRSRRRET